MALLLVPPAENEAKRTPGSLRNHKQPRRTDRHRDRMLCRLRQIFPDGPFGVGPDWWFLPAGNPRSPREEIKYCIQVVPVSPF